MVQFHERTVRDEEEVRRIVAEGHQATIWTALPCVIDSYNETAITVKCRPTIQGTVTSPEGTKSFVNMPSLVDVPVVFPRGGGYTMTFPIQAGDECLVVFSSRCIDGWWQAGGIAPPTEHRMHDLSDGFALVGPFSQKTKIAQVSTTTTQLRSDDGTMFVELSSADGTINVKAPVQVVIDSPATIITGVLSVLNNGGLSIAARIAGIAHATVDFLSGTVSGKGHVHTNVSSGSAQSGPPVIPP